MKKVDLSIILHESHSNSKINLTWPRLIKKSYCKFLKISFLFTDKGVVEILRLHREWNKAGYTAIQSRTVGQEQQCKNCLQLKNVMEGLTDELTDGPTWQGE